MSLRYVVWSAGAGGDSQGAVQVGTKRQRVKQYGNAVTPPVAEVIIAALVECIQGYDIDWSEAS